MSNGQITAYTMGYKYRIYPNKTQTNLINRTLGCCRFVFNHFLAVRRDQWGANNQSVTYVQTAAMLTDLKRREETAWLKEVDSMALQESLRNLDTAYKNFFEKRAKYPRFKSRHCHSQSYRTRNQSNVICFVDGRLKLPKIGLVKIKQHRDFEGRILNATVSCTASGKYFVSLCIEQDIERLKQGNNGGQVGIDVGIKEFYSDSNGNAVPNPRHLCKYERKLAREQRRFARKMPKSHNRDKQRIRVARVYEKIANVRKDFLHRQSIRLVRENQTIAIEDLRIKNMMKNHRLAKAISDVSWSEFFRQLKYKAGLHGSKVIKIPTFYPSSQTCHICGYQNREVKELSVREWTCPKCGEPHMNRDTNAAINILEKALADSVA
jgi:putative transposase